MFTQYDTLHDYFDYNLPPHVESLDEAQRRSYIETEADKYFKKECVERLNRLVSRLKKLKWVKVSSASSVPPFSWYSYLTYVPRLSEEDEYRHTFVELVQTTYQLVRNHVAESVWVASATAQRVDVNLNVESSIRLVTIRCS